MNEKYGEIQEKQDFLFLYFKCYFCTFDAIWQVKIYHVILQSVVVESRIKCDQSWSKK